MKTNNVIDFYARKDQILANTTVEDLKLGTVFEVVPTDDPQETFIGMVVKDIDDTKQILMFETGTLLPDIDNYKVGHVFGKCSLVEEFEDFCEFPDDIDEDEVDGFVSDFVDDVLDFMND